MDAAENQARRSGIDGFSYADLSREVGIRKASIHYHFPTKADLLSALMERYATRVLAELEHIRTTHPTRAAQLQAFVALYRTALQDGDTLCLCVAYAIHQDGLPAATRAHMLSFRAQVLKWLDALPPQVSPFGAATILATVEGAQIAARIARDLNAYDRATACLTQTQEP